VNVRTLFGGHDVGVYFRFWQVCLHVHYLVYLYGLVLYVKIGGVYGFVAFEPWRQG
jgi:hypothetical protein